MTVSRRTLLASVAASGLAVVPGVGRLAFAADAAPSGVLVVLFQRGACDGLNLVGPVNDPGYVAARIPELRVLDSGDRQGHRLDRGPDRTTEFRLHPDAGALAELYADGALAIVHAAGLVNGTRSHFVAQDMIERGVAADGELNRMTDGWLGRVLALGPAPRRVAALSTAQSPDAALLGYPAAIAVPDLGGGLGLAGGDEPQRVLSALYAGAPGPVGQSMRTTLGILAAVDGRLPRGPGGKPLPYQPEPGPAYEGTEIGRALKVVAQLVKLDLGLRVACVDMGGWDTHEGQPGRFANLVGQLSQGLAAFHNDLARCPTPVTTLVMTEFGRRLRSNFSQGTDHGHAGVMLALGSRIKGGRIYGRWPGLAQEQLDQGVDLAVATDYRAVLAELLEAVLGVRDTAAVFPGFARPAPLGLA